MKMKFKWRAVESSSGINYGWPFATTKYMQTNCVGPAIYRWEVFSKIRGDLKTVYVGETEDLVQRIDDYLIPGPSKAFKDCHGRDD